MPNRGREEVIAKGIGADDEGSLWKAFRNLAGEGKKACRCGIDAWEPSVICNDGKRRILYVLVALNVDGRGPGTDAYALE